MRLADLQTVSYQRLRFPPNPPDDVRQRILAMLNETYREILGLKNLSRMRRTVVTFASVTNTPFAVLPQAVVRIHSVADRVRNWLLESITLGDLRTGDPGLLFAGAYPRAFVVLNTAAPAALDPSGAAALYVVSTSPTDSAGLQAYLEGMTADGQYRSVSVPFNGTTPMNVDATLTNWTQITKFYIGDGAVGTVTLTEGLGGPVLSTIVPKHSYARYTRLHFYPTPNSVNTYYADVDLHVEDLVNDQDEPIMPEDFHWLLVSGVVMKEMFRRGKLTEFGIERARYTVGVRELQAFVRAATLTSRPLRGLTQFSQLGAYFRNGT